MPEKAHANLGLPFRPVLFSLDQIATMLAASLPQVQKKYIFYEGRSTGVAPKNLMTAHNLANEGQMPDWRVSEVELIRWLRFKGFRIYDRAYTVSG